MKIQQLRPQVRDLVEGYHDDGEAAKRLKTTAKCSAGSATERSLRNKDKRP